MKDLLGSAVFKVEPMWLPMSCLNLRGETVIFSGEPYSPFKPMGLMLWDLPPDAQLEQCNICNRESIIVGHGSLPAKVFARAQSYETLKARVENGEELFSEWIAAPAMQVGNRAIVRLKSEIPHGFIHTQAAFWGHAVKR